MTKKFVATFTRVVFLVHLRNYYLHYTFLENYEMVGSFKHYACIYVFIVEEFSSSPVSVNLCIRQDFFFNS